MDYSLIIPIFNEQNTLEKLLFQLKNLMDLEIIIINEVALMRQNHFGGSK